MVKLKGKVWIVMICVIVFLFTGYIAYQIITYNYTSDESGYPISINSKAVETTFSAGLKSDDKADAENEDIANFKWEVEPMTKKEFTSFLIQYNKGIAFKEAGRRYDLNMPTYQYTLKDMNTNEYEGLDSIGFVDWAFRNVIGTSLNDIENTEILYEQSQKVTVQELQVGDIGMKYIAGDKANKYGIFIGTCDNIPVFAHCSDIPVGALETGGLQFSYLESVKNQELDGVPAVSLNYFIRPEVNWNPGVDIINMTLVNSEFEIVE